MKWCGTKEASVPTPQRESQERPTSPCSISLDRCFVEGLFFIGLLRNTM